MSDSTLSAARAATPHATSSQTSAVSSSTSSPAAVLVYEDYHSAYNAVVQPDKYVACSRYFIARWMPLLGGVGTQIVLALCSLGFYNPRTGERREGIAIELPELAALSGVSVSTLKREFGSQKDGMPANPHLHRFVQRERQVHRDMTGRIIRTPNVYVIKMDDPLHELDQPKLEAELEKRADKSRTAHSEPYGVPRIAQNEPSVVQTEPPIAQIDPRTAQNEPLYKVSITPITKEIPQTSAALPGVLPSAVGGQDQTDPTQTDEYRAAYRLARRAMSHPDFKAKHGRPSGPADWDAGARERMKDFRPACPATPPEDRAIAS